MTRIFEDSDDSFIKSETSVDITKQVIPIGIALAAGWLLCNLTYSAGSKVSTADTQLASISARVDGIVKAQDEANRNARDDHDKLNKIESAEAALERECTTLETRVHDAAPIKLDVSGK